MKTRRQKILDVVDDLGGNFLYYDRKEDEELPPKSVEEAVAAGEVTLDEIVEGFRRSLERVIPG
jgi:hypothetical protein